jgi:hypothetical protein
MDDQHRNALHRALHIFQGASTRWAGCGRGMTDAELRQAVSMEFGTHGGGSMHGGWTAKGDGPAIWFGHGAGKPDLTGKPLLDAVRELLDVRATPQGRAPWAGLPLMQMDAR